MEAKKVPVLPLPAYSDMSPLSLFGMLWIKKVYKSMFQFPPLK
jgi:hypothetical protein